jgi:signal transduction histidine kinase
VDRAAGRALLAGVLVRLCLMPFAAHSDLMHIYWGAHLIAFHHKLAGFEVLLRYFHAAYLRLIAGLLPATDQVWRHAAGDAWLNPFLSPAVGSTQGWFEFISQPQVYRTLTLLKLPYLFFDLGCALLLYRLGSDRARSRQIFRFWWLNPILIFAVYVFGRHEVIALFFIILSLYWIKQGKHTWGLFALGISIAIRYYAVLLLPFFVLSLQPAWKKRGLGLVIGLAPWLTVNSLNWALTGSLEASGLAGLPQDAYLLAMKLQVAAWDTLYLFPLAYLLLILHRLYNREVGFASLRRYSLVALLLLFATAYTGQSPHYWTWLLPLLALGVVEDGRLLPLHVAQILCLAVYSFIGNRSTAGYLFAPIAPDFFWSLPSPVELISRYASAETVIGLARTALSAITLWMAYLVFRQMKASIPAATRAEPDERNEIGREL